MVRRRPILSIGLVSLLSFVRRHPILFIVGFLTSIVLITLSLSPSRSRVGLAPTLVCESAIFSLYLLPSLPVLDGLAVLTRAVVVLCMLNKTLCAIFIAGELLISPDFRKPLPLTKEITFVGRW
jgi:hypothetical protein